MFYTSEHRATWAIAIERHRLGLLKVVAQIVRIMGLSEEGGEGRLEPWLYRRALRLLQPAESACRRLIVVAARGLEAPVVAAPRPKAPESVSGGSSRVATSRRPRPPAFKLFDPRKVFRVRKPAREASPVLKRRVMPHIRVLGDDPHLVPVWARPGYVPPPPPPSPPPPPVEDGLVAARPLARRLEALKAALDNIPKQARRLARWQARRHEQFQTRRVFTDPLRPGNPPGWRRIPAHAVDTILKDCEALAWEGHRIDTS